MPIFNWGEKRQYVKQNRTMETSKELAMSKVEDQVKEELANAWVKLNENWKQVEIANSTLEIARENLKLNTFSYNEGKLPILVCCLRMRLGCKPTRTWFRRITSIRWRMRNM